MWDKNYFMKKVYKVLIVVIATLALGVILVWINYFGRDYILTRQGNELITKIELYQKEHNELPNSLVDLGIEEKEDGPLYYEKSGSIYRVWFGTGLGDSKMYFSDEKKWGEVY